MSTTSPCIYILEIIIVCICVSVCMCIYIYTHYNQLSPFIHSLITVRFAMSIAAMVTCSALASVLASVLAWLEALEMAEKGAGEKKKKKVARSKTTASLNG